MSECFLFYNDFTCGLGDNYWTVAIVVVILAVTFWASYHNISTK